ncbi:MAG: hypothetical protein GF364_02420 [Candidatus Lokiarchaeota archaeon]|nr:hypothetical protein [Candidatus Lokiarchaeota archaeon]
MLRRSSNSHNRENNKYLEILFFGALIVTALFFFVENANQTDNYMEKAPIDFNPTLEISGAWTNTSITIDNWLTTNTTHSGNWTWALAQPWCDGLGTFEKPYLIENITFNTPSGENGLTIQNTHKFYVKIRNCSFTNLDYDTGSAGLHLNYASNVTIYNCTFDTNFRGIYIFSNSDNNTIRNNTLNTNYYEGIYLNHDCDWNNISNNKLSNTIYDGNWDGTTIYLRNNCNNNTIHNNTLNIGEQKGIGLLTNCKWNNITYNKVTEHDRGIDLLYGCSYNNVHNNTLMDSDRFNLKVQDGNHNNITFNHCDGSTLDGLVLSNGSSYENTDYNTVINNTVKNAEYGNGINIYDVKYSTFINNTLEDNKYYAFQIEDDAANNDIISNIMLNNGNGGMLIENINNIINNTIDGGTYGIRWNNNGGGNIHNNSIGNVAYGLRGSYIVNADIENNTIEASDSGMDFFAGLSIKINNNSVSGLSDGDILCRGCNNINITANTMDTKGLAFTGGTYDLDELVLGSDNTVRGENIIVYEDDSDIVIDGNVETSLNQMFFLNCQNIEIKNCELSDYSIPVTFLDCESVTITDNNFSTNTICGISGININDTIINDNTINDIDSSVVIDQANSLEIVNNNFTRVSGTAVKGSSVFEVLISKNEFNDYESGIYIYQASDKVSNINISRNVFNISDLEAINIENCNGFLIEDNIAENSRYFVNLDTAHAGIIKENRIYGSQTIEAFELYKVYDIIVMMNDIINISDYGMIVTGMENSTIANNYFYNMDFGIIFDEDIVNNITIIDNIMDNISDVALELYYFDNSSVYHNLINNSHTAISLEDLEGVDIFYNRLENCSRMG